MHAPLINIIYIVSIVFVLYFYLGIKPLVALFDILRPPAT